MGGDLQTNQAIMVGSRQRTQCRTAVRRDNLRHIGFVGWTDSRAGRRKISQGRTFNINPLIVRILLCGQSKVARIDRPIVQDDGVAGLRPVERELKGRTGVYRPGTPPGSADSKLCRCRLEAEPGTAAER